MASEQLARREVAGWNGIDSLTRTHILTTIDERSVGCVTVVQWARGDNLQFLFDYLTEKVLVKK